MLFRSWPPFAEHRPDHRAGIELTAIDPHRAAKAAADIEGQIFPAAAGHCASLTGGVRELPGSSFRIGPRSIVGQYQSSTCSLQRHHSHPEHGFIADVDIVLTH